MLKKLISSLVLLGAFGSSTIAQFDSLILSYRTNVAVLMVDYTTYSFEGGNLNYYDCVNCDPNHILFDVFYQSPGDFGRISFDLNPSGENVFDGTIVWNGTGLLLYPTEISQAPPFTDIGAAINKPTDLIYFDVQGETTNDTLYTNPSDLVWDAVQDLGIVQAFDDAGYKSAIFLYTPGVGAFNPTVAKWVVFLYHQGVATSVETPNKKSFEVFPNPAQQSITIRHELESGAQLSIMNISGQEVHSQMLIERTSAIDISHIPAGPYFIQLLDEREAISTSFIKEE
ncbi:MAG TPA: hypothetical protein DDX92_06200 [Flavobacteriales bacterium]|jgi:hypothetical protein|nr:hypothetical protein [Flavobacteriales bacterium]